VLRFGRITFACEDTRAVAEFWAAVLGYEVVPSDADCFARGEERELFFKRMRKSPTIELPIGFCVQGPDPRRPHPYIGNVTFSCAGPRRILGPFWSEALDSPEQEIEERFLQMLRDAHVDVDREFYAYYAIDRDAARPRFLFQRREKSRPDSYPIHLDFLADDQDMEIDRLTAAGATLVETRHAGDRTWTVLRDPEGNPFCIE